MNIAIILSGGKGTRLPGKTPKQYIEVLGKPIIQFCLKTCQFCNCIDQIIIVADSQWQNYLNQLIKCEHISKFYKFAQAGSSRQHSILNGLTVAKEIADADSNVIIHDAARPNVSQFLITSCINELSQADAVMPVLPVKDTVYISEDGNYVSGLLNRDYLFAGQAPEAFHFSKYYSLNVEKTEEQLRNIRGSSELAYKHGLKVSLIAGDEHNYKITTQADLDKFTQEVIANNESIRSRGN